MLIHLLVSAACCRVPYGVGVSPIWCINISVGITVCVKVVITSLRLLYNSTVMSTVSFGIGTRKTFSNERVVVFASS